MKGSSKPTAALLRPIIQIQSVNMQSSDVRGGRRKKNEDERGSHKL